MHPICSFFKHLFCEFFCWFGFYSVWNVRLQAFHMLHIYTTFGLSILFDNCSIFITVGTQGLRTHTECMRFAMWREKILRLKNVAETPTKATAIPVSDMCTAMKIMASISTA